ncbi:MAG TPA: ribose-phosphate pyrophosphokinase [Moraxellaceae bacterium]|nr:ribose-phosphate pyrophosphokinase [Moraxellaceae bacterium]
MSDSLLLVFPGNEGVADALRACLPSVVAPLSLHRFPDGESLVTLPSIPKGADVFMVCSLDQPDAKLVPLLFAANAARELGAGRVVLVAPYLAYMRQDRRFHDGEAVTSRTFASVLSGHFDALVTVDPHLHRYSDLSEIYPIPARAASSSAAISAWVRREVPQPLLIGPDEESGQWVEAIARLQNLPFTVLTKQRHDDFHVDVSLPEADRWAGHTPVLVDDIISSAHTMIAAIGSLSTAGFAAPVCVGVHGLFAGTALAELKSAGAARIVTCNCVPHATNAIDVMPAVAAAISSL